MIRFHRQSGAGPPRPTSGPSSYPRDAMLAWELATALYPCPCLSVCLSQVGVLSKRMDGIIWFWACGLLSTSPTLCFKETEVSTNIRVLPTGTLS